MTGRTPLPSRWRRHHEIENLGHPNASRSSLRCRTCNRACGRRSFGLDVLGARLASIAGLRCELVSSPGRLKHRARQPAKGSLATTSEHAEKPALRLKADLLVKRRRALPTTRQCPFVGRTCRGSGFWDWPGAPEPLSGLSALLVEREQLLENLIVRRVSNPATCGGDWLRTFERSAWLLSNRAVGFLTLSGRRPGADHMTSQGDRERRAGAANVVDALLRLDPQKLSPKWSLIGR